MNNQDKFMALSPCKRLLREPVRVIMQNCAERPATLEQN